MCTRVIFNAASPSAVVSDCCFGFPVGGRGRGFEGAVNETRVTARVNKVSCQPGVIIYR